MTLGISKVEKIIIFGVFVLFSICLLVFGFKIANAQDVGEQTAAKYGVTFPISELGDCKNYSECRSFCEDPLNQELCIGFAKTKGFYKEEEAAPNITVLGRAKQVLGCTSKEACKEFCSQEINFDRCNSFAEENKLSGGYKGDPTKGEVLNKAKEEFGCDSYDSCKSYCDNPVNRDRCAEFARGVGVNGGYEYRGPGGCTSEVTCRAFCQNPQNAEICKTYAQVRTDQPVHDPQAECRRYTGCTWNSTYCQCSGSNDPSDPTNQERMKEQCIRYSWCSWTGNLCNCQGYDSSKDNRPEMQCSRSGPGCWWNGSSCTCSGRGGSPNPYLSSWPSAYPNPSGGSVDYRCGQAALNVGCYNEGNSCKCPSSGSGSSGSMMSRESQEAGCKAGGGTCQWNGDMCNCQGYQSSGSTPPPPPPAPAPNPPPPMSDPASSCSQYPGCSWNGSSCQCSSVQGAATVFAKNWFDKIIDVFLSNIPN